MRQTTIEQSSTSITTGIWSALQGTNGLMLLGCLGAIAFLSYLDKRTKKGKLATARFGSSKEKRVARRKAKQQQQACKHNEVGFKIYNSADLPYAERGIAICGGSGSGKTDSMVLPIVYDAIAQGFPIILYDYKYSDPRDCLAAAIVPAAAQAGYDVRVFAPGFPESEVCNPLDFLNDDLDGLAARQLGTVMNKNLKPSENDSDSAFFTIAGDLLTQAILMLAKQTKYPDMVMCQALLSLEKLPERIKAAEHLSYITKATFSQYLSVAKSEKTADSIRGTAQNLFVPFVTPGLASAFCGKSTLPLDIKGKQLIIIGVDKNNRDAIAPFIAGVLHMLVNRNMAIARTDPLVVVLDELHTLNLKSLTDWLAQNRSAGQVTVLSFQDLGQLEQRYGKEGARSLMSNCATQALFKCQEGESAKAFSDFLGEQEIHYKQKSRGYSDGKRSTNISDQQDTRKLFTPDQFTKLARGRCILLSPGLASQGEEGVPILLKIKLPKAAIAYKTWNIEKWHSTVRSRLVDLSPQPKFVNSKTGAPDRTALRIYTETTLQERFTAAESLLPAVTAPQKQSASSAATPHPATSSYVPPEVEAVLNTLEQEPDHAH